MQGRLAKRPRTEIISQHKKAVGMDSDQYPHSYKHPRPGVTADVAVLQVGGECDADADEAQRSGGKLSILLVRRKKAPYKDMWCLPGGFVEEHEDLEVAAARELEEETGLSGLSLSEVGAFGTPYRDPRGHSVTVCYSAVVSPETAALARAGDDAAETTWASVEDLPDLAFDHWEMARVIFRKIGRGIVLNDTDVTCHFHNVGCQGKDLQTVGRSVAAAFQRSAQEWAAVAEERSTTQAAERAARRWEEAKAGIPGL